MALLLLCDVIVSEVLLYSSVLQRVHVATILVAVGLIFVGLLLKSVSEFLAFYVLEKLITGALAYHL